MVVSKERQDRLDSLAQSGGLSSIRFVGMYSERSYLLRCAVACHEGIFETTLPMSIDLMNWCDKCIRRINLGRYIAEIVKEHLTADGVVNLLPDYVSDAEFAYAKEHGRLPSEDID